MSNIQFKNKDFFKEISTMIEKDQVVSFPVKGTSMHPFLKNGQTEVFIQKSNQYRKYDICLFKYKGKALLHRLIKIKDHHYYFRGDHLYTMEVIDKEDVIAKVNYYVTENKTIKPSKMWYRMKLQSYLLYKELKIVIKKILKHK